MSVPVWEEPPPDPRGGRNRRIDWEEAARLARTRPAEWLRLPGDYSPTTATHIRRGYAAFRGGRWEVVTRAVEPGNRTRSHIWVRYIGEQP